MLYFQMVQFSYIQTPPCIMPLNLRLTRRGITYDTVRTVDQTCTTCSRPKGEANTSPTPPVTKSQSHYITHLLNKGSLKPHTLTLITKLQSKPLPSSDPSPHVITHEVTLLAPCSLGSWKHAMHVTSKPFQ